MLSQKIQVLQPRKDCLLLKFVSLDPIKAHEHDVISIHIIKICASSVSKPLAILFSNCPESECFPKEWKKANIVPLHNKHDK